MIFEGHQSIVYALAIAPNNKDVFSVEQGG